MRTNGFLIVLFFTVFFICTAGCAYPIRYDGPYEGRVIDADTGKAIEGVVVLGVWYKEEPTVAGAVSSYYDARETLTDKNGEFKIPGMGLKILSNLALMNFLIFKAGYKYESGPWESLKEGFIYKDTIKWEGKKPIIPLKKLTMEERKKRHTGKADIVPDAKQKLLIRELNKEYKEIGIPLYPEVD